MLRSAAVVAVLVTMALGPIYAGADFRATARPEPALVASLARPPTALQAERPRLEPPPPVVRTVVVERGDTFGSLLAEAGLEPAAVARWTRAAGDAFDLRRVRAGRAVTLEYDRGDAIVALRYEIDHTTTLVVERVGDVLTARRETTPVEKEVRGIAGVVDRDLWSDLVAAGVPAAVASNVGRIVGGEVDARRIAAGDGFRVLYEVATASGSAVEIPGDVLAVELAVRGRVITAIRFADASGRDAYYAPSGNALGRFLLRDPVPNARISSRFSHRRFHPILRRYRPHLGVDFAAPRGTPVRATADGTVQVAGWKRGMGRMVRLRHAAGLETVYGHLHRIASGLRAGTRVRQGQVIGYVGSTGLATGSHLHYGVRRGGRFVNPLAIGSVRTASLSGDALEDFAVVRDAMTDELGRLGASPQPITVSLARRAGSEG